ncbi:MAG: response regulator [Candidatus Lokiarchaeota archaeon]|nr:response regulator [Candidatus Lokiarchaeota archaeon]
MPAKDNLSHEILDYIPAYIMLHDRDNRVSWINKYALKKIGLRKNQVINKEIISIFSPKQGEIFIAQNKQVFETGIPFEKNTESITLPKLGQRWFHTQKIPYYNEDGIFSEILVYMIDITDNINDIIAKVNSEAKYQKLFMFSPTPIIISDLDGKIIDINEKTSELLRKFDIEEEDFLYKHYYDLSFFQKTQIIDFDSIIQSVLSLKISKPIIVELVLKSEKLVLEIFPSILQQNNEPYAIQIIMQDITERKKTETLLLESESKYRSLFQDSPISLWNGEIDRVIDYLDSLKQKKVNFETYFDELKEIAKVITKVDIKSVNHATLNLFKAKSQEELIKNFLKTFPKESLANIKQGLIAFVKGNLSHETELLAKTLNNELLILDVKWSIVLGDEKKTSNILISMRDITEQKNFEQILQMQRDFGIALSNIHEPDSIIELCVNTAITVSGMEFGAMYIYDPNSDNLILKHHISIDDSIIDFLIDGLKIPAYFSQIKNGENVYCSYDELKQNPVWTTNLKSLIILPVKYHDYIDGCFVFGSIKKEIIPEAARNILQSLISQIGSVLSRIRMEKDLIERQRRDSLITLAKGIAHDFNNILTAAVGSISLAELSIEDPIELQSQLNEAKRAMIRSRELTKKLLMYGNPRQPTITPLQNLSITNLIKDTTKFALRGSSVNCKLSLPKDLWMVVGDQVLLEQVLNNIFINAVQSMPSGGKIEISAENIVLDKPRLPLQHGQYVKISIKDEGIGVPEKYLGKIFDPYFTTKKEGSGMGLAIANEIIRQHGGTIDVESTVGVGSVFYVYLPAAIEKSTTLSKEIQSVSNTLKKGAGRILIMDDDGTILRVASKMLEKLGYEVNTAKNGEEALILYKEALKQNEKYKAVIMDLTIPGGLGGKETIQELLKIDPEVIGIVSSGYSTDSVLAEFKKYGFAGMIAKPYRLEEINQVLSNLKI